MRDSEWVRDAGALQDAARLALDYHRWLVAPDADAEDQVLVALAALDGQRPYRVPLLDGAWGAWLWLERGGARPPPRPAPGRGRGLKAGPGGGGAAPAAARGPGAALGHDGRAPRPAADHRGGRARARPALGSCTLGPQLPAAGRRGGGGGPRPAGRDGVAMACRAG